MKMNINRFLAAVAIATAIGSPALAQSYDPAPVAYADTASGINAFAQAPRAEVKHNRSELNRSDVVTDEAGNVEADPDLNIRSQIQRENNNGF
jgi:hypothetical protein